MRDDAERRGASSRSSASRERERAGKIRKLTANIDLQRKELEFRQKRASRQREIAEKGQGSVEDAAMAELETARAQTMLAQMMQELEDVQKESSPESAGGQRGDFKMVVHDLSGLTEVSAQILSLAKAIVEPEGGWAVLEDNTLKVGAPEVQQRLVQALFRTIRGKGDSPTQVKAKP
jgi:SMC interacting uncharacterized protein involved in chromosome segregation